MESHGDVFLNMLGVVSASAYPSIKPESEKVSTQICEDTESQLKNTTTTRDLFSGK